MGIKKLVFKIGESKVQVFQNRGTKTALMPKKIKPNFEIVTLFHIAQITSGLHNKLSIHFQKLITTYYNL
jgi:hypothetical protein